MKIKSKRIISMMFAILLMIMNFKAVPITALNDFNININFASDYSSEQGYVEYKIDEGDWIVVSNNSLIPISEEIGSLKFKVIANSNYEVNFDNGPYLSDGFGVAFNAWDAEEKRESLINDGYEATLTPGLTNVTLSDISFRALNATTTLRTIKKRSFLN